ncbi:MAG: cyclase [Streptosporangiales bacterium]|nr:cyclase [Streptosporangiales bacterium]
MAEQTRSTITIGANRSDVMAVIADFDAYPDWANVKEVEVLEEAGGRANRVRFTLDAGVIKDTYVLGYAWAPDDTLVSWHLAEEGSMVSAMDGSYELAGSEAATVVTYELTVDVKLPMIGLLKRKAEKVIVDTALKGLKKRVEG